MKRDYLEKTYLVFIRPILEYASEIWDNCRQTNCNRIEKVQIEAAPIVTGLSIYASLDSIGVGNIKYKKGSIELLLCRNDHWVVLY
jgi:hypothetical protein